MANITEADFKRFTSIKIAACGTSWHAGLAGKYMIEQLARCPSTSITRPSFVIAIR